MTKISVLNQTTFLVPLIGMSIIFVENAAHAVSFNGSLDCSLSKFQDKKWQPARESAVEGRDLSLVEATHRPGYSNFLLDGTWYSAKSSCFSSNPEKKKIKESDVPASSIATSQFQHQADKSVFEITPSFAFSSIKGSVRSGTVGTGIATTDYTTSGYGLAIMPEYGISDNFSVGMILAYENLKNSYSTSIGGLVITPFSANTTTSGLEDPEVFMNARVPAGPGLFHFATKLSAALSHAKVDSSGNTNAASGGVTGTPQLGYEFHAGPSTIGLQAQYDIFQSDRTLEDTGTGTASLSKGGQKFASALFYEFNFEPSVVGISFQYAHSASTTSISSAGISTTNDDATSIISGTLYGVAAVTQWLALLPEFNYGKINGTNLGNNSAWGLGLGARFKIQ